MTLQCYLVYKVVCYMGEICRVVSLGEGAEQRRYADALAIRWGLELGSASSHRQANFELQWNGERLQLVGLATERMSPLVVDFVSGRVAHRRLYGGGRGEPIAKAIGLRAGYIPSVVDATAGLGGDAFVMASLGCQLTLLEQHPVVAALLDDGLRRARVDPGIGMTIMLQMQLEHTNAIGWLERCEPQRAPDVVYLDPMFPHTGKHALAKKGMQVLQQLLDGDEADESALLAAALRCAHKRVVVKRPASAAPLAHMRPTLSYPTKKHRFDAYVLAAMAAS